MSNRIEKSAFDDVTNRQLFTLELSAPNDIAIIDVGSPHFCCLIAWDASESSVEDVSALIDPLIKAGCVYFVCWGPSCEWVHDIIDESTLDTEGVVMTTWHSDESLEGSLWYFLNVTWPDEEFEETFKASIGITIGSNEWTSEVKAALSNPRGFSKMVLEKEEMVKISMEARSPFTKLKQWFAKDKGPLTEK